MKKTFVVNNINCQNCANMIKGSLEDDFGTIEVDMTQTPKHVSLELNPEQVEGFKEEMAELGFDVMQELS